MATCLGLYIEDNIIKYAKVSKDNDVVKVDSFGIKFYDKLNEALHQVIEETYSYKVPISINLSDEAYNYFHLFSLLNKKDIENVINTEFESLCYEKSLNKDAFETRFVLANDGTEKEKIKAIHVSANKADIAKKTQQLEGYKVSCISPVGMTIANLIDVGRKENAIIVNIENKTTVTTIIDEKITDVKIIDEGASQILNNISIKENSYSKAYEICKGSTIYTSEGKDLQYEENEYLDDIMPTLYNIVVEVRKHVENNLNKIDRVYLTGTASVINNIDIYFQEYLNDVKCEILKPYFIQNVRTKINVKDYIEVNSPISLALQGLGSGIKAMNFKKESLKDKLPDWLTADIGGGKILKSKDDTKKSKIKMPKKSFDFSLNGDFDNIDRILLRCAWGLISFIIIFSIFSSYLNSSMKAKQEEIDEAIIQVNKEISKLQSNTTILKNNTSRYVSMRQKLEELNTQISEKQKVKKAIPTLLNQIMSIIPKEAQITSIQNTTSRHIVINAQAEKYEQLGYFISKIKNDGILTNLISDSGQKQEGLVKVTIEGELP